MQQVDLFGEGPVASADAPAKKAVAQTTPDWRAEVACRQPQLLLADAEFETLFCWDDAEIEQMRIGLLWSSIRDVCDGRESAWSREEVWEWITDDGIWPFSFRACVAAYDPRIDPETMREAIDRLSSRLLSMDAKSEIIEEALRGLRTV